jgi:hypothetical protein
MFGDLYKFQGENLLFARIVRYFNLCQVLLRENIIKEVSEVFMKKNGPALGEHWKESGFSPLYQLYSRVEYIANELRKRQRAGHQPLAEHVRELDAIALDLRILDKKPDKSKW